jgi:ketopantoate reductase
MQNGGSATRSAERFTRVIGGVIRHNCTRVRRGSCGRSVWRGSWCPSEGAGADVEVADLLRSAGYDTGVSPRIAEDRWLKLCVNLMSTPNALVRRDDTKRARSLKARRACSRSARRAAAAGIAARSRMAATFADEEIAAQRAAPARGVAARKLRSTTACGRARARQRWKSTRTTVASSRSRSPRRRDPGERARRRTRTRRP